MNFYSPRFRMIGTWSPYSIGIWLPRLESPITDITKCHDGLKIRAGWPITQKNSFNRKGNNRPLWTWSDNWLSLLRYSTVRGLNLIWKMMAVQIWFQQVSRKKLPPSWSNSGWDFFSMHFLIWQKLQNTRLAFFEKVTLSTDRRKDSLYGLFYKK